MAADTLNRSLERSTCKRNASRWRGRRVGLLGGSFNPAHRGHLHISLEAMKRLRLDALWWLVSPGNPLKPSAGMADVRARLASARKLALHPRLVATTIEAEFGTRYTAATLDRLLTFHPETRFIWLMGADNLLQFDRWQRWRAIAHMVPIAVLARPGYVYGSRSARAMIYLREYQRPERCAADWPNWEAPAIVMINLPLDATSATAIRTADPDWAAPFRPLAAG